MLLEAILKDATYFALLNLFFPVLSLQLSWQVISVSFLKISSFMGLIISVIRSI